MKVEVSDNPRGDTLPSVCFLLSSSLISPSVLLQNPAFLLSHVLLALVFLLLTLPYPDLASVTPTPLFLTAGCSHVGEWAGLTEKRRRWKYGSRQVGDGGEDKQKVKERCPNYAPGSNLQRQARPPPLTLNHNCDLFLSTLSSIHHRSGASAAAAAPRFTFMSGRTGPLQNTSLAVVLLQPPRQ